MSATTGERQTETAALRRGWWRRNWKRLISAAILVPLVLAAGGYFVKFGPVLFSEPYRKALATAMNSPQLIAQIGEPIKRSKWADWAPAGAINKDDEHGEARFSFSVTGPKGKADLSAVARRIDGQWGFSSFEVTTPGDQHFNLLSEINKGVKDDTPVFDATSQKPVQPTVKEATPDQDVKIDLDLPSGVRPDKK